MNSSSTGVENAGVDIRGERHPNTKEPDEEDIVDLWLRGEVSKAKALILFVDETNTVQGILATTDTEPGNSTCLLALDPRIARVALPLIRSSPFINPGYRMTVYIEVPGAMISIEADGMKVEAGAPEELMLFIEEIRYILSMVLELEVKVIPQTPNPETICIGGQGAKSRKMASQELGGGRTHPNAWEEIVALEPSPSVELKRRRRR